MIRAIAILFLLAGAAAAVEPDEMLADPAMEERAQELGKEIRCLVCRSESIEDSNATFARDVRLVVRERIEAGDSDAEVLDFLTERFGEYIRLRPAFSGGTILLWLAGPVLLVIGGLIAARLVAQRRTATSAALSSDEEARLAAILSGKDT